MKSDVAIILLNYNNYQATIDCIKRLHNIGVCSSDIIIVDNNSTNDSLKKIQNFSQGEKLIQSGKNGGYAYGNNIGIKRAIKDNYQYVCIMNPDIFFDSDFITPLVKTLENDKKIGVIGPCLRFLESGNIASMGGTFRLYTGKSSFNHMHEPYVNRGITECDYISGGCMVAEISKIEEFGLIPEEYFLDYEDNEWCNQVKKKGYKVVCLPSVYVFHEGESTINTISGLNLYFMYRNRVLFEKRNARIWHKIIFYPYMFAIILFSFLSKSRRVSIKPYIDGFTGKNKYSYLIK